MRTAIFILTLLCVSAARAADDVPTIYTVAGTGTAGYSGDNGAATAAQLNRPGALVSDSAGNVYIADRQNHVIRKLTPTGVISTFAGTGEAGFTAGSGLSAAQVRFDLPGALAIDGRDVLYVADTNNHRIQILDTVNGVRLRVWGAGTPGFSGDGGNAAVAELNFPMGIAVDNAGNVYIADTLNNRVRRVDTDNLIATYAGNGGLGERGDGSAAVAAQLNLPAGLAVDAVGNLFIADQFNHRVRIVDSNGVINTYAGNGIQGYSGDGGPAMRAALNSPYGLSLDSHGNLFISEVNNHVVRQVDVNGMISTVAGNGTPGDGGDGGDALGAQLNGPLGLDAGGSLLYIADSLNHGLRVVDALAHPATEPMTAYLLSVSATGNGLGRIIAPLGTEDGIDCGINCSENYVAGASVTLAASAEEDSFFVHWEGDCDGIELTTRLVMAGGRQCSARFENNLDNDSDSVPDVMENSAPNGDGNGDGIADSEQRQVASFRDGSGHFVTVVVEGRDCVLEAADTVSTPSAKDIPYLYQNGLLRLETACSEARYTWYLHERQAQSNLRYRHYGPVVPGDTSTVRWYAVAGAAFGTATVNNQEVLTLQYTLRDGNNGDDTPVDGRIVSNGGVAAAASGDILEFAQSHYQVREDAGFVVLSVQRNSEQPYTDVGVAYRFEDGTASRYMADYSAANGQLQWEAGDGSPRTLSVKIIDNPIANDNRGFSVVLHTPSGGATVGENTATVTILNDDDLSAGSHVCPLTGTIDTACNAAGLALQDITLTSEGHATGGKLQGVLRNYGWVSHFYLLPGSVLEGGVLAGNISGPGTARNTRFHGNLFSSGRLEGDIDGGFGLFRHIRLAAGAQLENGSVAGIVRSDPADPGLLDKLEIHADTIFANIRLGANVEIPWNEVRFGAGIQLSDGLKARKNDAYLVENLPVLNLNQCANLAIRPPSLDLSRDTHVPPQLTLDIINNLPLFSDQGLFLFQHPEQGYLLLDIDVLRLAVQPWQMALRSTGAAVALLDGNVVEFTLGNGLALYGYPAVQDPCALQAALGMNYELRADGTLRVPVNAELAFAARPDIASHRVAAGTLPGLRLENSLKVPGYFTAAYVFIDDRGHPRKQYLYPGPAHPPALYERGEGLTVGAEGQLSFTLGDRRYQGVLDYVVETGIGPVIRYLRVEETNDRNGDGVTDFLLLYPNRERQVLFASGE